MHNQQRCFHLIGKEKWRVLNIELQRIVHGGSDTRLGLLILKLAASARVPPDSTVCTGHVRYGRSGTGCLKHIGLGNEVGYLITSPALSLYRHVLLIHPAVLGKSFRPRDNRVVGIPARLPHCIVNIGSENNITAADKKWNIDGRSAGCRREPAIQFIGMLFIEINHHRILFERIKIFGFVKDPL